MNALPLVSIVIPVYNGANYLREAIESALAQTYPHVEVLVVNDGSTDGGATAAIANSYGTRIRYFEKTNGGVSTALNTGIREMRGEYFSWLSHDDVFLPNKLSVQMDLLRNRAVSPEHTILYSDYNEIDAQSRMLGRIRICAPRPEAMRFELIRSYPVHGCTTLIPRSCLERHGCFDESRRYTQDYHLWFLLSRDCQFLHIPQSLMLCRRHSAQGMWSASNNSEVEALYSWMLDNLTDSDLEAAGFSPSNGDGWLALARSLRTSKMLPIASEIAVTRARAGLQHCSRIQRRWAELGITWFRITLAARAKLAAIWNRVHQVRLSR